MSDLIYRQDAVSLPVMPKRYRHYMSLNLDDVYEQGWEDLQMCIEYMQSAQPQRNKGKWITVNGRLGNEVECNQCHSVFWYWMGNYRFCPSCGADMRGESNE